MIAYYLPLSLPFGRRCISILDRRAFDLLLVKFNTDPHCLFQLLDPLLQGLDLLLICLTFLIVQFLEFFYIFVEKRLLLALHQHLKIPPGILQQHDFFVFGIVNSLE